MFWLVLGKPENWITAFNYNGMWGLKKSQTHLWQEVKSGDTIFFYATSPISGIIGQGVVSTKFRQEIPLWPEETHKNEVIWPLRFQFNITSLLSQTDWESKRINIRDLDLPLRSGFQILSEEISTEIMKRLKDNKQTQEAEETIEIPGETYYQISSHNEVRDIIVEMGRMQGYSAEKEFPMDGYRLDAVWKRIFSGSPTYVFEVQVGGSIEAAISKLKHAYDKWNSNMFIVIEDKNDRKLNNLLSGTFHEIKQQVRVLGIKEIGNLYELKRSFKDREKELGIH